MVEGLATGLESRLRELSVPVRFQSIFTGDKRLLMLLNFSGAYSQEVIEAIREYARNKAEAMPETTWVIGGEFTELSDLGKVYRDDWQKLLGFRFYFPGKTVLQADELPPARALPAFDMKELLSGLKRGQAEEVFARLRELAAEAAGSYLQTPFEFKSFLGNAVFHVTIATLELHCEAKELDGLKYAYFKAIDEARDAAGPVLGEGDDHYRYYLAVDRIQHDFLPVGDSKYRANDLRSGQNRRGVGGYTVFPNYDSAPEADYFIYLDHLDDRHAAAVRRSDEHYAGRTRECQFYDLAIHLQSIV